jgi:hypothetical protein
MKQQLRARLSLEPLESRWCPALTAGVSHGLLTISGAAASPSDTITVKETAANTFEVDDNGTAVSTDLANVNSVRINLSGSAGHILNVDLGTFTLSGNLSINLGGGTNALNVSDGSITGRLSIAGGSGTDTVDLGGTGTLSVGKNTLVDLGAPADNSLTVQSGVTLSGSLVTGGVNNVTLAQGSSVARDLLIFGGNSGSTVDVEGSVGRDLAVVNPFFAGNQQSSTTLTLGSTASVGNDLIFLNARSNAFNSQLTTAAGSTIGGSLYYLGSGKGDVVDLAGSVAKNALLDMRGGNNQVTLESGATISGAAGFFFGNGDNALKLDGTIGTSGSTATTLFVAAGSGSNTVTLDPTATVNGSARIRLGSGNNTLDLHDAATITGTLTAKGGGNSSSTFHGSTTTSHPNLNVTGFPNTDGSANP